MTALVAGTPWGRQWRYRNASPGATAGELQTWMRIRGVILQAVHTGDVRVTILCIRLFPEFSLPAYFLMLLSHNSAFLSGYLCVAPSATTT